jgi:hypothetical protein
VNTKITSSCVTERVYCAYLFVSSQHVIIMLVDSPYVHARVLRGAISPHSGSKAFLRVQNMTVGNSRNCRRGHHVTDIVLFDSKIQFRGQSLYRGSRSKLQSRSGLTPKRLARLFYPDIIRKVRPGPSGPVPFRTSNYCCQEMPANSESKRNRYFSRRVRTSL